MQKDIDRREHNKLHMQKYHAGLSKEKKEIVKLYDRNRRHDKRYEKLEKSPSYNQIIYCSKQISKLLGHNSVHHGEVLGHVLNKSMASPNKRRAILGKCKGLSHYFKPDPENCDFKTPQKN